jgi:ribonuclease BN (tRNA processing enzyme)
MRLTVLGKSPSWQDAGGACSGYLLEEAGTSVVVDCGNGVFGKLRQYIDYVDVDAVVLSHLHADHFLDLVPYAYALTYAPRQQPVPVITEYEEASTFEVGPFQFSFRSVPHFMETFAIRIDNSNGGGALVYGADSSPNDQLTSFARNCELLLIEATLPRPERTGIRGHLTPREAGEHGRAAGARRIVLTHISDELDWEWAKDEAADAFGGPVEVAGDGDVYEV